MITSAHVVSGAHEASSSADAMFRASGVKACVGLLLERRGLRPGERPDLEDEIARQLTARAAPRARVTFEPSISVILPNGRRLPARVAKYSPPVAGAAMSGRNLALLKLEAADLPTLPFGDSEQAKIGDRLRILGFPNVVMGHELLSASAKPEASITGGAISGFKEDVTGQPVIQTDASTAGGDSGGPAVNNRGEVIGVLTFVSRSPDEGTIVQGFNFIIPAAAVRDFLKDTGVALGERSNFNRAWWAALSAFFAGDHVAARPHLAEANRVVPDLPDVRRLIVENAERIKNPPPRPFRWLVMGGALTMMGAIACALAWTDQWKRNRFRVAPREIAKLLDSGADGPVLLDVRDSATYRRSPVQIPRALHVPVERLEAGDATLPVETDRAVVAYCT